MSIMDRKFDIGCEVIFFDSLRQPHRALVTHWFHGDHNGISVAEWKAKLSKYNDVVWMPICNVVYVAKDESKRDPYGRQVERATSVNYGRNQGMVPFLGMCWCWPDELEEACKLAAEAVEKSTAYVSEMKSPE